MKYLKTPTSGYGKIFKITSIVLVLAAAAASIGQSNQSPFPRQMAWTAYNLGTTGYNQAVAIGAMLREKFNVTLRVICLLYTSPSPRDGLLSRMPSSA